MNDSKKLIDIDNQYVWHPFTQMQRWLSDADDSGRMIVGGEGFELIDSRGRRFIDGFSSLWCNLHGHRVPQIDEAIRGQLEKIAHSTMLGHASEPATFLAEKLVKITPPGLDKVFYSDSGASAVEIALKMAHQFRFNQRRENAHRFIALKNSYHGDTIGAVSLGGIEIFHHIFEPLLFNVTFVDSPNHYHHPAGGEAAAVVLDQIEKTLIAAPDEYCAIVVEPLVQGAAGILTHPKGFLRGVREIATKHGVLLITDEVATGFTRTGKLFACDHEYVAPDIMTLGKGLTGGYLPVAATMVTQEIFDAFIGAGKTFYHGHTYTGNPLGCAAAIASTDLISSSGLLDTLDEKIALIAGKLSELEDHPHVGNIRQCGMMAGIELVANRKTKTPLDPAKLTGAKICHAALKHGIIIRPLGDVITLVPAPAMNIETLTRLLDGTIKVINEFL